VSPPEAVYPRSYTYRIAASLSAAALVSLLFYFHHRLPPGAFWGVLSGTILFLGLFWKIESGRMLQIHAEGIVLRHG